MKKIFLLTSFSLTIFASLMFAMPGNQPTLSRVYSNPFVSEELPYNQAGVQGTLYPAFGTTGSLSLNSQLSQGQAKAIQVLSDSTFVVALSSVGSNSIVAKYNADGSLNNAFGLGSGVVDLGVNTAVAQAMISDYQGNIVIAGGDTTGTSGWINRVAADGSSITYYNVSGAWYYVAAISQQSSGKIIAVGFNGTNAQVSRYTIEGFLDTTFAVSGNIIFDGLSGRPSSSHGLYNIVVDADDNFYIFYRDNTFARVAKFTIDGVLVPDFGTNGIATIYTSTVRVVSQMRMAMDQGGQLILGVQVSSNIKIKSINASTGDAGSFADFETSVFSSLYGMIPTSDGKVVLVGSNADTQQMAVMRLTSAGFLDNLDTGGNTPFNDTNGYNLFNIDNPTDASVLYGASVSPNGLLYVVGYQSTDAAPAITPYVSVLYNAPYVSSIAQYPTTSQQGNLNKTFGNSFKESIPGVVMPYNGFFNGSLQQKARAILELPSGDLLVGYDGYTDSSAIQTMMLAWLRNTGNYDTDFGFNATGKLTLDAVGEMVGIAVAGSGAIYVAGTNGTPNPVVSAYTSTSTTGWTNGSSAWNSTSTGTAAVGIALQATSGILLFSKDSDTAGHISRYTTDGVLDSNFGDSGTIATNDLSIHMGPVYGGGVVDKESFNIYIAYKNSATNQIDIALIAYNGRGLINSFGINNNGVISNIFNSASINASDVRIAFGDNHTILVAAVNAAGTAYLIRRYNALTGAIDTTFNDGSILTITPEISPTALHLTNLVGVTDGSIMLTGYDAATDPVMLTLRLVEDGSGLDTAFNPQGAVQGVLPLQIENETTNYTTRNLSGIAIQSGVNDSGSIVLSAFEQQSSTLSTPEVMRVYGAIHTAAVQRYPTQDQYPGTLNTSLNDCGAQDISSLTSAGTGQIVYAYPDGNTHEGMLLIGVDNGTNIYLARVDQVTLAYDTTFNAAGITPGLYVISGVTGLQNIMVDAFNQIIICGSDSNLGWAQQIPENANSNPVLFAMPSDITSATAVYQQRSGRYMVVGSTLSAGLVVAFQNQPLAPAVTLAVDTTFNPLATGSTAGTYAITGSTIIPSLVINYDDSLFLGYQATTVKVAKLLSNGAGLDNSFGTLGIVDTGITPVSPVSIRVASNDASTSEAKVIIAASTSSGLSVVRYTNVGTIDNSWNSTGAITTIPYVGSQGIALTSMLVTATNQTIALGYNTTGTSNGNLFAIRLNDAGLLDTTWNPLAVSPDVPGVLTFGAAGNPLSPAITILNNAYISIAGNIFAIGSNGTDPIIMQIIGDTYVTQVAQGQVAGAAGTLDTTIAETFGFLNIDDFGVIPNQFGFPTQFYIDHAGNKFIIASAYGNNEATTNIIKFLPTLALDTSFAGNGYVVIPNADICNDMFVADAAGQDGTIYATGSNNELLWAATISANGNIVNQLELPSSLASWTEGDAILAMSDGTILLAGFNGNYGAIVSLLPGGSQINERFGNYGMYQTGSSYPITAMNMDNQSRIYIAYKNSDTNTLMVQRLLANGAIDSTFAPDSLLSSCDQFQIQMVVDNNHAQIIVANYYQQCINVTRLSMIDGSLQGTTIIAVGETMLNLADLFVNTNQQIYVAVRNQSNGGGLVVRLNSISSTEIAFDTTYGQDGIADLGISGPILLCAGQLDPDSRVYITVFAEPGIPYMTRFFGNNYYAQISPAVQGFAPGLFDASYGAAGIAYTYAGGASSGQQARTIMPLQTGTQILAVVQNADGSGSWTVRLLSNGNNDPVYGDGQGIAIPQASTGSEIVQSMIFDGNGLTLLVGSNSVQGGFIKSILPTGSMNSNFGSQQINAMIPGIVYMSQFDSINAIAQLNNGNYVIAGSKDNVGIISLVDSLGVIISTFGSNGFVSIGANVTSLSVDASNTIYAGVASLSDDIIYGSVVQLNASGRFVTSYGTNGMVTAFTNINDLSNLKVALDDTGKIVIAGAINSLNSIVVLLRINSDGTIDTTFNDGNQCVINFAENVTTYVTSLVTLQNGNILVAGYQYDATSSNNNDYEFVASVTTNGSYDTEFNAAGDVPGLLTFQVADGAQNARNIWNMSVQNDGQILLAGSEETLQNLTTPLTMRVDGYIGVQPVQQFPGYTNPVPTPLNPNFGTGGLAYTTVIDSLVDGGCTAVDSQNRVVVGGITTGQQFVVARFLSDGALDPDFGNAGIAESPMISTLHIGNFITIDRDDSIYIGGITLDSRLIVARFLSNGTLDTNNFNPTGITTTVSGVAASEGITNLMVGGYLATDYTGKIVLGGMTSDFRLVVARFTTEGLTDGTFGTDGIATTSVLTNLKAGGYVATAQESDLFVDDASIYIGASTLTSTLMVVKFANNGTVDTNFGTAGIAETGEISQLVNGGSVGLTSQRKIVVGGYTFGKMFVAAMFDSNGSADNIFSGDGIAFSNPLASLDSCANIWIDGNDNILFGGLATANDGSSKSMVVARLTSNGFVDITLSSTGSVSTGIIPNLTNGGFVTVNNLNQPFVGGFVGDELIVAGLYAGIEIIIEQPQLLPAIAFAIFKYGNNPSMFTDFFAIPWYALTISDAIVRQIVIDDVMNSFDQYAGIYRDQSDFNLAANATAWQAQLNVRKGILIAAYESSSDEITGFFDNVFDRIIRTNRILAKSPLNTRRF